MMKQSIASAFTGLTGLAAFNLVVVHLRDAMRMVDASSAPRDDEHERDVRAYLAAIPFINGDAGEVFR